MAKVTGLKKAIGEYNRANSEGDFSPRYGKLMFDTKSGEIWCDEFYSLGHNEFNRYHSPAVIDLGAEMWEQGIKPTMQSVKGFCAKNYGFEV